MINISMILLSDSSLSYHSFIYYLIRFLYYEILNEK